MFEPSLVQYESPQLVSDHSTKAIVDAGRAKSENMILMNIEDLTKECATDGIDMLDVLMPPRIVEDSDKFWYQRLSRRPATTADLDRLTEKLNEELLRQQACEIGLCDKRRNLYDQLFDELVRQEIIDCPQSGRLLRMVRRETELSLTSLLGCYESGLAYGIKKKLASCSESARLKALVTKLLSDIATLNDRIRNLEPKLAEIKKSKETEVADKESEFQKKENEISKENEALKAALMQIVNVNIEVES